MVERYAALIVQITKSPDVVIAYEPMNPDSGIGKLCEFPEKPHKTSGDNIAVFVPVIYYVAEQIYLAGIIFDGVEESYDSTFL